LHPGDLRPDEKPRNAVGLEIPMHEEHERLLEMWSKRERHEGQAFVKDGIIDPVRWSAATPKVLILLKEAYGDSDWDLRDELKRTGANHRIWWNAAYWCYAAYNAMRGELPPFPDDDCSKASDLFLGCAVVNVKKSNGVNPSGNEDIASYAREDGELIRQQIELINPDIIICGKVWSYVRHLWPDAQRIYDLVWQADGRILVDFWHPACQFPKQLLYYTLGCLLRNAVGRSQFRVAA